MFCHPEWNEGSKEILRFAQNDTGRRGADPYIRVRAARHKLLSVILNIEWIE